MSWTCVVSRVLGAVPARGALTESCGGFSFQVTWTALAAGRFIMLTDAKEKQEQVVSYLPLSHIAAQMSDIWTSMTFGAQVFFAQPDALKVETYNNKTPSPTHPPVAGRGGQNQRGWCWTQPWLGVRAPVRGCVALPSEAFWLGFAAWLS